MPITPERTVKDSFNMPYGIKKIDKWWLATADYRRKTNEGFDTEVGQPSGSPDYTKRLTL